MTDRGVVTELDSRISITLRGLIDALYRVQGIENRTVPIERIAAQAWAVLAHTAAVARARDGARPDEH